MVYIRLRGEEDRSKFYRLECEGFTAEELDDIRGELASHFSIRPPRRKNPATFGPGGEVIQLVDHISVLVEAGGIYLLKKAIDLIIDDYRQKKSPEEPIEKKRSWFTTRMTS